MWRGGACGRAWLRPRDSHPRSVAAAIAALRDLKANRARLLTGVAEMSEYFRVRLLQLDFDRPAAVRIQGLAIGIDVATRTTRTPSTPSAVAMGCSCQPKARRCCCCRRWRSTSGPPREDWTSWRARYDAPRRPAANPRVQLGASLRGQSRGQVHLPRLRTAPASTVSLPRS
jgi:hypothetical protein